MAESGLEKAVRKVFKKDHHVCLFLTSMLLISIGDVLSDAIGRPPLESTLTQHSQGCFGLLVCLFARLLRQRSASMQAATYYTRDTRL